jgi:hypothetical protein
MAKKSALDRIASGIQYATDSVVPTEEISVRVGELKTPEIDKALEILNLDPIDEIIDGVNDMINAKKRIGRIQKRITGLENELDGIFGAVQASEMYRLAVRRIVDMERNAQEAGYDLSEKIAGLYSDLKKALALAVRDATVVQRETLDEKGGWLFLVMADGERALPDKNKSAYLIPWNVWKETEATLLDRGISSLTRVTKRNMGTDDLFTDYRLVWERGNGWTVPKEHVFWKKLQQQTREFEETVINGNGS